MKIKKFCHIPVFIIIFLSSSPVCAQPQIEKLIRKGLEYNYNFNFKDASEIFQSIIKKYPEDPRGYHYLSSTFLWYYLSNKDEKDFNDFVAYSDLSIDKAKAIFDENSSNENIMYMLGNTYTYRAIAFAKAGNYLDAAWASKKSETYLSDLIEKNPHFYDAYLGLGLYNFAIGQISPAFKWALNLAGISGDKDTGIKYIKLAASKGSISKVEAHYYLSQIYSEILFDYDSAEVFLKKLVAKYPGNILFNYSFSVLEMKKRNLNSAEKLLMKITKSSALSGSDSDAAEYGSKFRQLISLSNFLLGDLLYRKNMFDSAKYYYQKFIDAGIENDYKGIAHLRLGLCYELTGERDNAVKNFKYTAKGNMDIDDDIYARRKGEIYTSRTLDQNEIYLITSFNLIESGNYNAAHDSLLILFAREKSEPLKAETALYLSEAAYYLGNYSESMDFAQSVGKFSCGIEKWIKPFADYYAARASHKLGNDLAAKNLLEEADNYTDFDYQNKLKNMLYSLENSLNIP
jgi:hypothetical protein